MAGRTVWEDTVSAADARTLDPGVPDDLDRAADVLVVGGGIVGLACAAMCRRAGLGSVVLLERDRLAGGTSGSAAGGLSPDTHLAEGEEFGRLGRRSLNLHRELSDEWGYDLEVLDEIYVSREPGLLHGDLLDTASVRLAVPALGDGFAEGLRFAGQARVHPLEMAAAFARRGGQVATRVEVGEVTDGAVETSAGTFTPRAVVLATGTVDSLEVSQELVKGHLIATEPATFRLGVAVVTGQVLVLQLPDGRLVAGGTLDLGDDEDAVRLDVCERIRDDMVDAFPAAASLKVTNRWCCFRPATEHRLPVIDRVSECVWATCGHFRTGLLMAPATGEAMAAWIASGERPGELEGFGADRPG